MECKFCVLSFYKEGKWCLSQQKVLQKESIAISQSEMNLFESRGLKLMGIFASKISESVQLWKMDIAPQKSAALCFN